MAPVKLGGPPGPIWHKLLGMTAWIALIIAAGSLSWNITSTVLSWRRTRVIVLLSTRAFSSISIDDIGHTVWLQIIAMNKGGSPVAVTAIGVQLNKDSGWRSEPSPMHPFKSVAIVGPDVPTTIEVNHLASWYLDMAWVVGTGLRQPGSTIHPYVELSDGSIIKSDYVIEEGMRTWALQIFERRRKYHEKDQHSPRPKLAHHCPECDLRRQDESIFSGVGSEPD